MKWLTSHSQTTIRRYFFRKQQKQRQVLSVKSPTLQLIIYLSCQEFFLYCFSGLLRVKSSVGQFESVPSFKPEDVNDNNHLTSACSVNIVNPYPNKLDW